MRNIQKAWFKTGNSMIMKKENYIIEDFMHYSRLTHTIDWLINQIMTHLSVSSFYSSDKTIDGVVTTLWFKREIFQQSYSSDIVEDAHQSLKDSRVLSWHWRTNVYTKLHSSHLPTVWFPRRSIRARTTTA